MAAAPFNGLARKLMLPLVSLSAVGWLVFVIGFGIFNNNLRTIFNTPQSYPFWAAAVFGPIVYISAVIHAALWRQTSSILGSITAVLSIVYFTAMGYLLHATGIAIYNSSQGRSIDASTPVMFAGSFIACFFWAGVLATWPWYKTTDDQ